MAGLNHWIRNQKATAAAALAALAAVLATSVPLAQTFDEYQLKAAFLFHFTRFVEWQDGRAPEAPLAICILGADPFGTYLDDMLRGEVMNRRPLAVRRYRRSQEALDCDILYISGSESDRLTQIIAKVRDREMLTVSDVKDFAHQGGIVELWTERDRVRLKVNIVAARSANLVLSSKLLRSAEVVDARP